MISRFFEKLKLRRWSKSKHSKILPEVLNVREKSMKRIKKKNYTSLYSYNSEPEDISIIGNNLLETVPSCNKKGNFDKAKYEQ